MANDTRPKIVIEFHWVTDALGWFDDARRAGLIPAEADLYCADALDMTHGGDMRTFTVRNRDDRPDGFTVQANLNRLVTKAERAELARRALEQNTLKKGIHNG